MIGNKHFIKFTFPARIMGVILKHAEMKELGGNSHIRKGAARTEALNEDQIVGAVCTFAGTWLLTGRPELYYQHMEETGSKWKGDDGTDLPGAGVDYKGSMMRVGKDPARYNLLVRPREFHEDRTYVLALVESYSREHAVGYLVGWMESWEILEKNEPDPDRFGNAYRIPSTKLHPVMRVHWNACKRNNDES